MGGGARRKGAWRGEGERSGERGRGVGGEERRQVGGWDGHRVETDTKIGAQIDRTGEMEMEMEIGIEKDKWREVENRELK